MVREEARDSVGLVVRHREEVAEPSAAEDDLLARALGVVDGRARVDLRRTDGSHERAGDWEVGVELRPVVHRVTWLKVIHVEYTLEKRGGR